jgi:hypothetical protein
MNCRIQSGKVAYRTPPIIPSMTRLAWIMYPATVFSFPVRNSYRLRNSRPPKEIALTLTTRLNMEVKRRTFLGIGAYLEQEVSWVNICANNQISNLDWVAPMMEKRLFTMFAISGHVSVCHLVEAYYVIGATWDKSCFWLYHQNDFRTCQDILSENGCALPDITRKISES